MHHKFREMAASDAPVSVLGVGLSNRVSKSTSGCTAFSQHNGLLLCDLTSGLGDNIVTIEPLKKKKTSLLRQNTSPPAAVVFLHLFNLPEEI